MKYFLILSLYYFISSTSFSKEAPYFIGAEIGYGIVSYDANFSSFEGISKCGIYESGTGKNLRGRLFAEYKVLDFLNVGIHAGYLTKDGILNKPDTAFARNLNTGQVGIIETNSQLDISINAIDLGVDFNFLLQENLFNGPLFLNISPSIHLLNSGTYKQTEIIENPDGAAFKIDDKILFERINAEGEFTTLSSSVLNLSAALYNNSKIAENLYLIQRVGFANDMGSLLEDADISSFTFIASIGIKVSFDEKEEYTPPIPPQKPIQPLPIEPKPIASISFESEFDYNKSYIEKGDKLIATTPLILAVFFNKNSSEIPSRYNFNMGSNIEPIENHYNLFSDIIEILNDDQNAKLALLGSTSGKDENNNIKLAEKRVESVKDKFIEMGLNPERIVVSSSVNPRIITNPDYETGLEENRRVEIDLINANSVEFIKKTEFEKLYGIVNFEVDYKNLKETPTLSSSLLDKKEELIQNIFSKRFEKDLLETKELIEIKSALEADGLVEKDNEIVNIEKLEHRNVELKTDEFEAVLVFDFADSKLKNETQKLLLQLIQLLPNGKTIQIVGNSDNIGLERYNIKIADERAQNAIEFIQNNTDKTFNFEKVTNSYKFDESTPQGRYLNRSIIIRIK